MKIDSEEKAIFIAERKEWGVRSVSKLNRPIQLSAVGAGFACPKTQSKQFSGEPLEVLFCNIFNIVFIDIVIGFILPSVNFGCQLNLFGICR